MKKYLKVFICLLLTFALIGCGKSAKDKNNTNVNGETNENTKVNLLEKFVEENKSSVETFSNEILDATLVARDNSLVYVYTYKTKYESSVLPTMKKALETSINEQADTFNAVLNSIKAITPDAKSVIIEYYNADGTLIASIEFK